MKPLTDEQRAWRWKLTVDPPAYVLPIWQQKVLPGPV